jgi:hypothetical protein
MELQWIPLECTLLDQNYEIEGRNSCKWVKWRDPRSGAEPAILHRSKFLPFGKAVPLHGSSRR